MTTVKNMLSNLKSIRLIKIDPHIILLLLVIMFVVLLFAAENVVKLTLIPQ
ncbi:MAG: hypothetical protein K9G76_00585 [Bacteroidales bacterium]|nr:hypothetical protein [Bacteroidales bacterium]MCF8402609.1 hypothetical protein [Bacteroidales bacterium]